jgi:hypothetical protein
MGRIAILLLGLLALALVASRVMSGRAPASEVESVSAPKATLDNARKAAARIEAQQNQQAEEALEKAAPRE